MNVSFNMKLKTLNESNTRCHWAARAKRVKSQRGAAYVYTRANAKAFRGMPGRIVVVITRVSPGTLDDDGLVSSQKAVRDGIADGLGVDDGDTRVAWVYRQRRGGKGNFAVEVTIARAEAPLEAA